MHQANYTSHGSDSYPEQKRRTDQQWLDELRDTKGSVKQSAAFDDLTRYLTAVALRCICNRKSRLYGLDQLSNQEVQALAQDMVQDVLLKLSQYNYRCLDQFSGTGTFTAWVAQITVNHTCTELRKACWQRNQPITANDEWRMVDTANKAPEQIMLRDCTMEALWQSIVALPTRLRTALVRCVIQEEKTVSVATDMGISLNALYILIHRAKQRLRREMLAKRFDSSYS